MAKGNSKAYLNNPIYDNSDTTEEENAILCQYALDVFNSKEPDLSNPDEVKKAIDNYFGNCISKGLRPGNLGLYAVLGLDRRQVFEMVNGRITKGANRKSIEHLKKAQKAMSAYRESLGAQGKLNPATLIFWQKNFDGLEDVQRVELDANAAPKAENSPEDIARMIETDVPIDAEYQEVQRTETDV